MKNINHSEFLKCGKSYEKQCAKNVSTKLGWTFVEASRHEDINDHIDIKFLKRDNDIVTVDVKGPRKISRSDKDYSTNSTWVELKNVNGKPGWLYGKSDYIAFINKNFTYLTKTSKLASKVEKKIYGMKTVTRNPKKEYIPYQRFGRKDKIVLVPIEDIIKLSDICLNNN